MSGLSAECRACHMRVTVVNGEVFVEGQLAGKIGDPLSANLPSVCHTISDQIDPVTGNQPLIIKPGCEAARLLGET